MGCFRRAFLRPRSPSAPAGHQGRSRRCLLGLFAVVMALAHVASASTAQAPTNAPSPRIAIDDTLAGEPIALPALDRLPGARPPFPLAVRVRVPFTALEAADGSGLSRLDDRVRALDARGFVVWLAIETACPDAASMRDWGGVLRTLAARVGPRVRWIEIAFADDEPDARLAAFALKQAVVELRAVSPDVRVLAGGQTVGARAWLERLYAEDIASYIDGLALPAVAADPLATVLPIAAVAQAADPGSLLALTGVALDGPEALVRSEMARLGTPVALTSYAGASAAVASALVAVTPLADLLAGDLVPLDPAGLELRASPASVKTTPVYDASRFATTIVYRAAEAAGVTKAELSLTLRRDATPSLRDPFGKDRPAILSVVRDLQTQRVTLTVPLRAAPLVLDLNDGLADAVSERSEVTGQALLSVGEILARHQQARAADDRLLAAHIVRARMDQHFRPTSTDPGFDVVTDNRFFADRDGVEWEELSFSVNGTKWGPDRPPFPLLQPEKVLSPPLDLRLDADYRYRLDGTATVDGVACYVVRFDPVGAARSLYRGTVWIDRRSFRRVKLQAVQTGLSAPVVSNDETVRFAKVGAIEGRDIHLPVETTARQIVLIAGRNILVEKSARFTDYELNPSDFAARRLEARGSERVMYRETDRGMRYYVKDGGTRVVSERATTGAKAMALGVTIDPSYDFPLPILGINYLDFEFGGPDSQLALLFGGVLALGNVQRPKLIGPIDGSVDFFAIAVPGTDRIYEAAGSRESERLLTWPLSAGGNLGWQYTSFQKLSAQYQFRFDGFLRDRTTSEDYVVPRSTTTDGVGVGWEYRRGGYSLVANSTWFARRAWEAWGPADALVTSPRTYTKYSVSVSKEFYLNLLSKVRVNGAYFGGRGLDRFSQYQFGLFDDTRIHGVPSAGVRFGELAMVRGSYSFNAFEQYRFDLFLDRAWGRDRDAARLVVPGPAAPAAASRTWDGVTGVGVAFNLRAPWNTILRAEVGRSVLPERYQKTGSTVVQILFLKPMGRAKG